MTAFDTTPQAAPRALGRGLRLPGLGTMAAATVAAAAALLPVVQSSNATTAGYQIRQLERQKADLQAEIYNAQMDVAQLGSLDRIDRVAREQLGMVPADQTRIIRVDEPLVSAREVPARYLPPVTEARPQEQPKRAGVRALLARLLSR